MFLAHLPAGYLLTRALRARLAAPAHMHTVMAAGMIGAIAPDLDLLWFYLVDLRAHPHHSYWSHFPIIWLTLLLVACLWKRLSPQRQAPAAALMFASCGLLHMILDSVAGGIRWLAPWSTGSWSLTQVGHFVTPWWLNFFLHWSILIEAVIIAAAWHQFTLDRYAKREARKAASSAVQS